MESIISQKIGKNPPPESITCKCFVKRDNNVILHYHDCYEFSFLPKIGCLHKSNDEFAYLPKNSIILMRPEDYHDFFNPDLNCVDIIQLYVSINTFDELAKFLNFTPIKKIITSKKPPFIVIGENDSVSLAEKINKYFSIPIDQTAKRKMHLLSVLIDILNYYFSSEFIFYTDISRMPDWLVYACNEIKKPENFSGGIERMTELAGVSREHLSRSIKKFFNHSLSEHINELRLTYIANMLIYSDVDIINLCYYSGFSNLGYMYSLFKKKYSVSPDKFRKMNKIEI